MEGKLIYINFPTKNIVAVYKDLTEKKIKEENLVRSNERLALALKSANAGVWDWDMNTEKLSWAPELYNLFGLDPEKMLQPLTPGTGYCILKIFKKLKTQ